MSTAIREQASPGRDQNPGRRDRDSRRDDERDQDQLPNEDEPGSVERKPEQTDPPVPGRTPVKIS
jgi:hypothetical protein